MQLVASYESQLGSKQKEVLAFQQKYNIRIKGEGGSDEGGGGGVQRPGGMQGVLVGS